MNRHEANDDWRSRAYDISLKQCGQRATEMRVINGRIAQVDSFGDDLIGYPLKDRPQEGVPLVVGDLMGGIVRHPFGVEAPVIIDNVVEFEAEEFEIEAKAMREQRKGEERPSVTIMRGIARILEVVAGIAIAKLLGLI